MPCYYYLVQGTRTVRSVGMCLLPLVALSRICWVLVGFTPLSCVLYLLLYAFRSPSFFVYPVRLSVEFFLKIYTKTCSGENSNPGHFLSYFVENRVTKYLKNLQGCRSFSDFVGKLSYKWVFQNLDHAIKQNKM